MGKADILIGLAQGWLVAERDEHGVCTGWFRFVWDFHRDPDTGKWIKTPAAGTKRVRVFGWTEEDG